MSATVAETVWYQEDSVSPLTVAKPASFGAGQMLVVAIVQHNNPSAQTDLTTPAGWTFRGALDGTLVDGKVFSYVFTGSDPASWDFPYKSTADVAAGLFRITGADVTTPTLVVSTTPASVSSPMDSPSLTPTGADDLLLALISDICNGTVLAATFPSGMTDLGLGEVTGHFMSSRAAYQQLSSGSATGVRTWTSVSPTGIEGGTWTVAIKSAASGGGTGITPAPLIVTAPARAASTRPIVLRSTLQDPAQQSTPGPLVVTNTRPVAIQRPLILRSSLQDAQSATPQPYVVTNPTRFTPGGVLLGRASLADAVVAPPASTPAPIVVVTAPKPAAVPPVYMLRSALADPAVTPGPTVVSPPARTVPTAVLLLRSPPADPATPGPYVITAQALRLRMGQPILLRSSLADPIVVTVATPQPLVVSGQPSRALARVLLLRAPGEAGDCDGLVHRPNTGTVTRPNAGTVTRPFTGTVTRPRSCP